uniref:Uncharacterized protein n=1 Tax=Rhizophora mucronata TaxID=61149 RepID=A0A2P2NME3_RHIMU
MCKMQIRLGLFLIVRWVNSTNQCVPEPIN